MFDPITLAIIDDVDKKHTLKTSQIEKDLKDYQATLSNLNPNQEAKQSVTDYGIVSLPKNCANGQISGVVRGLTATNLVENGDFSNGISDWVSVGVESSDVIQITDKFIANGFESVTRGIYQDIQGNTNDKFYINLDYKYISDEDIGVTIRDYNSFDNSTKLYLQKTSGKKSIIVTEKIDGIRLYIRCMGGETYNSEIDNIMVINLTQTFGAGNEPTVEQCDKMFANWFDGTKSTVSAVRLKSESADKTQHSLLYLNAGQVLRSLPNGVKDEISAGKLTKKIKQYTLQESDVFSRYDGTNITRFNTRSTIISDTDKQSWGANKLTGSIVIDGLIEKKYADSLENIGTFYTQATGEITFMFPYGTTLGQARQQLAGTVLTYQLAQPEVIPIQSSGTLVGHPSGTVYVEPVVANAGLYTDEGIGVTHTDLPIDYVETVYKIDESGVQHELDPSEAVIATDKLSFTHPSLVRDDIVFFTYFHNLESTIGETTIEYYDSRYTIKDKTTGKFYKWNVVVDNGVASIELVEV